MQFSVFAPPLPEPAPVPLDFPCVSLSQDGHRLRPTPKRTPTAHKPTTLHKTQPRNLRRIPELIP